MSASGLCVKFSPACVLCTAGPGPAWESGVPSLRTVEDPCVGCSWSPHRKLATLDLWIQACGFSQSRWCGAVRGSNHKKPCCKQTVWWFNPMLFKGQVYLYIGVCVCIFLSVLSIHNNFRYLNQWLKYYISIALSSLSPWFLEKCVLSLMIIVCGFLFTIRRLWLCFSVLKI